MNNFFSKVFIPADPNKCWLWTGARRNSGKYSQAKYGSFRVGKKTQAAHRVSYAYFNGRLDGDIVMHTCDNTLCVNPAHLKTGTVRDNVLDKLSKNRDHNQRKTHCPHGHPYEGDNMYVDPRGSRKCRTCLRAAYRKHDLKRRPRKEVVCVKSTGG